MICEICNKEMRRAHRETAKDYLFACLCFFPYRCPCCQRRRLGIRWEQAALFYGACTVLFFAFVVGVVWYKSKHRPAPVSAFSAHPMKPGLVESEPPAAPQIGPFGQVLTPVKQALSNADIADLSQAHLAGDVVTRLIRTYPHNFQIDPKSLIELKKAGTPDMVISAMIDSTVTTAPGQQVIPSAFHTVPY